VTEIELDIPQENNRISVRADQRLIQRAVTNLIINADRYKSSGPVRVRMAEKNNRCFVYVENSMDQISEEIVEMLNRNIQPEFSGDGTAMHGTGLQLVRQIAKAHGGKLVFTGDDTDGCNLTAALSFRM
jgi:K+-sensing histidine kinase KdpD